MVQRVVWDVSIVLMVGLGAIFAWVALGADLAAANYGDVATSAYRLRGWLFAIAILVLIGSNYKTLGEMPYVARSAPQSPTPVQVSQVIGEQWAWTIKPNSFVVGQTAEFHVTSKDVNHGFALYDPDFAIVAQTQAMPGYTNILRYTFTRPGTYQVLCLEYCGVMHHEMKAEVQVVAGHS